MSQDDTQRNNLRRVSRKDRKRNLSAPETPFPSEDTAATGAASEPELPDLDNLGLPESDDTDLSVLAALPSDTVRMPTVTPREERFPPLPTDRTAPTPAQRPRQQPARPQPRLSPAQLERLEARRRRNRRYNVFTGVMFLLTFAVIAYYAGVWMEPFWIFNPFPPEASFIEITATPEQSQQVIVITTTPEPGVIIATQAPPVIPAAPTTDPTQAALSPFPFIVTDPGVTYIPNSNQRGCEWSAIAGTVRALDGSPIDGFRVKISGDGVDDTVFSGSTRSYGEGAFELPLGNVPTAGSYMVQLFTPQGAPVSDVVTVVTSNSCEQNVAILNFAQIREL